MQQTSIDIHVLILLVAQWHHMRTFVWANSAPGVIAYCLAAPEHQPNQFWIIKGFLWQSTENNFAIIANGYDA